MLWSGWSRFISWFPIVPIPCAQFQAHQLQLISLSPSCPIFTSVLTGGISLNTETAILLRSAGLFQVFCLILNNAVVSMVSILPLISNSSRIFSKFFRDLSKYTNYNWYKRYLHVSQLFFFLSYWHGSSICLPFHFLSFSLCDLLE